MFKSLRLSRVLNGFLILGAFNLSACFAHFAIRVDLVGQVLSKEVLFLPMSLKIGFNLVESLLRTEVWLVIKRVNIAFELSNTLSFGHLVADEVTIGPVLSESILVGKSLRPVHVIQRRIELIFLKLTLLLDAVNI